MKKNYLYLFFCFSLLSFSNVQAKKSVASGKIDSQNTEQEEETQLSQTTNIVKVIAQRENLIGKALSASEGLIGREEIAVRPLLRTGEVLELVPGMVVTQHSGTGKANQYFLRGFNLDHGTDFATFVDDMPVNFRTHGHGQGYTDLNFVIPEVVGSIAYKKGTYYAEVGDFSGVGSAQMSIANQFDGGLFEVTSGSKNYQRFLLMDQFKIQSGNLLYALENNTADGHWSDINENLKKNNALIKYNGMFAGGELSTTFMAYDNSWNSADQIPLRAVESGLIDELGSIDKSVGGKSNRYSLSSSWTGQSWRFSGYAIQYDLNLWGNFTYLLDDPVHGDQIEQVDNRWSYGANISYQTTNQLFEKEAFNLYGIQWHYDAIDEVALYKTTNRNRLGAIRSDAVDEMSLGIYWQNKLELSNNLRSTFGLRYDYYDFDVNNLVEKNIYGIALNGNSGKADDSLFSAKASLIYQITDNLEVYGSAGQGFHSNDARGTTVEIAAGDGTQLDPVKPLIRSSGGEIGLRRFHNEKLNASIAFWFLNLDSELIFVGDAGNTEPSGKSERKGFELTAYYHINENWTFDLEYAQTDGKYADLDSANNKLPGAIDKVVQLGISSHFPDGYFGSLRFRYFGERPLTESGNVTSDSSTMVNFRAGYRWNNWVFKFDILNLLDSRDHDIDYYYESQLVGETEPVEDFHFHPFEPRSFRVSVGYRF